MTQRPICPLLHWKPVLLVASALLALLLSTSLALFLPGSVRAGTISGNFTTLTACPMNLTCFTVDPTTGLMYGQGDQGSTNYYRYNPSTNTWSTLAACPQDSGNNGGACYLDGKIYNSYCDYPTMAIYTIATNSWTTVAGSPASGNIASDGTDIYVSASGVFKKWDVSASSWVSLTATTTQAWGGLDYYNGYLYSHDGNSSNTFKRYNIATNTWQNLTNIPGGAVLGSAIYDAYYYCMGSYGGTNLYSYDLGAGEWNNTLTLPWTINDSSIVVYGNSLYICQGEAGTGFSKFTPNNPILSGIEGTAIAYTIDDPATQITTTLSAADNDDTNLESGTVSITANFQSGKDTLNFTNQNGITGSWNSSTGVLTLTGSATIADWVTALRSVTYSNTSHSSTTNTRTISFQVNDGDHNSNVQARSIALTVPTPEMSVEGNSVTIADGDTTPSTTDHTDFGSAAVSGGTVVRTFTIRNTGTYELTLSGDPKVAVSGSQAADFTVTAQPSSPVDDGDSTTFQVTFDPSATGVRTATISITNDDSDENPYNFNIQGRGTSVLTVSGVTAANKVYDGAVTATLDTSGAALVGITSGETVTLNTGSAAGTFSDKNVATGKTVTVSGLTIGGPDAVNYTLTQPTISANITKRTLTVTATGVDRVYDGSVAATVTLSDDRVAGDTFTASYTAAVFADRNVGTGKAVSVSGITISGTDAENYDQNTSAAATASITARPITVTAATDSRVYDGTTASSGTPTITSGSLGTGDNATWTQTFDNKNAGTGKTLTPAGTVGDGNSGNNYTVTFAGVTTGTITAKTLTVSGVTAASRPYDGTTTATLDTGSAALVGIVSGDSVTLNTASAAGAFADKNAGTNKIVFVSGLTIEGTDAGNYSLTQPTAIASITRRAITVTATTDNRTYSGTTNSSAVPMITSGSMAPGDSATWTQTFDTRHAGTGKTLTPSGTINGGAAGSVLMDATTVGGGDASNYSVTFVPVNTGVITPLAITVTAAADSKGYDGTVNSAGVPTITSGSLISGDNATWTQTFDTKHVGTGKTLTPAGTVEDGNSGNNYTVTFTPVSSGTITPRAISVTAVADSKIYDGTSASAGAPTVTSGSLAAGDNATWTQTFDNKNVGTGKTITPAGTANDGNSGNNYTVTFNPVSSGTITQKGLTVSGAAANNRVYDGTDTATLSLGSAILVGVAGGDNVTLIATSANATFADKTVGAAKTVTVSGLATGGSDAANYSLSQPTLSANITAKALTVTGITAVSKVYDGTRVATLNTSGAALAGVVSGDNVTLNTTSANGTFADSTPGIGKTVSIAGLTISGTDAANYSLTQPTTTADITVPISGPSGGSPPSSPTPTPEPGPTPAPSPAPAPNPAPASLNLTVDVEDEMATVPIIITGAVQRSVVDTAPDNQISLSIREGTVVLTNGRLTTLITVDRSSSPPAPPAGKSLLSAYECLPAGTTFDPPITLVWRYDPAKLPAGADESRLTAAVYNEATGAWETIGCVVDTTNKTVTASVSHFSLHALLIPQSPQPTTTPAAPAPAKSFMLWLIIVAAVVVAALVIGLLMWRRRKAGKVA